MAAVRGLILKDDNKSKIYLCDQGNLIALFAANGKIVKGFGENGKIKLKKFDIPDPNEFQYKAARDLFKNPDVENFSDDFL